MATEVVPSLEFGEHHLLGMNLVGTVALPSPFPATARLFVVRYPAATNGKPSDSRGGDGKARQFLKIVETINSNHLITRIVDPEQVRAVKWYPAMPHMSGGAEEPETETGEHLRGEIAAIDWSRAVKDPRSSYELPLHPDQSAVVYVAEAAPVLLRHEQTVPAAVSLSASPALLAAACPKGK
jgi:hypothetical protein